MKKKSVVLGLLSLLPMVSTSFIYEVKVLRKWNDPLQDYHYFVGFSDFHDKSHAANKLQVASIDSLLNGCDRSKTKILVEDLSSQGNGGRCSCGRFSINSRGGVLGGLATVCRDKGFDVENVEYRYCRVSSLGPVLNNLQHKPHDFPSVNNTQVMALAQEIDAVVTEIKSYDDGHDLGKCYQHCLDTIKPHIDALKSDKHAQLSVADYVCAQTNQDDRLEFLKHLLTFDSGLLDAMMVHSVVNARHKHIIAISGGAHISRVSELLEGIGYEVVYATDVQFRKEYDVNKCVGSNIVDGTYCIRPEPIELETINQYLKI